MESRQKPALSSKLRQLESDKEVLQEAKKNLERQLVTLNVQLADAQAALEEEIRQKLAFSSKLRQLESDKEALQEQMAKEEEAKKNLERQLNVQLTDAQVALEEETRQKLAFSSKLRQLESDKEALQEQMAKEEEAKKNLERQLNVQLTDAQVALEEETRQKLAFNSKLRQLESDKEALQEQMAKEEEAKKNLELAFNSKLRQLESDKEALQEQMAKEEEAKKNLERQLNIQLTDAQVALEEETRQNLAFNSKLRQLESDKEALQEQMAKEEEAKKNLERQLNVQLTDAQVALEKETRQKLAFHSKLRQLESDKEALQEQMAKEEEAKKNLELAFNSKLRQLESDKEALQEQMAKEEEAKKNLERQLNVQLTDAQVALEEETPQKLAFNSKLRQLESDKEALQEQMAKEEKAKNKLVKLLVALNNQLADNIRNAKPDAEQAGILEESKKKLSKDMEILQRQVTANDKLERSKEKIAAELEDANIDLKTQNQKVAELENKQNNFDKVLVEKEARDKETLVLCLNQELIEMGDELERVRRQLQGDLDEFTNNQGTADKNVHKLEKVKNTLKIQLKELLLLSADVSLQIAKASNATLIGDIKELESQIELQWKVKKDVAKRLKKSLQQCKEAVRDAEEAITARDELAASSKEAERDELMEEINSSNNKGSLLIDEKRRLEARIATPEEELEEEQSTNEMLQDRARKAQLSTDHPHVEKGNTLDYIA